MTFWLPIALLHATPAALPVPPLRAWVCQAGSSSSSASSSSGSTSSAGSSASSSSSSGNSGSGASSSSSSSSGSTSSAASSSSSSNSSSSSSSSSGSALSSGSGASSSGARSADGGSGIIGNPTGDSGAQNTLGIPAHCNVNDDCPLNFDCVKHKCKPNQHQPTGGCTSVPGLELGALAAGLFFLGLQRRRRRP